MTGYLLALLYFLVFLFIFKKVGFFRKISGLSYKWVVIFFSLKVVSGFSLSLIYKYYYDPATADIFKYFNDGLYLYSILWESPSDFFRILSGIGIGKEQVDHYLSNMSYWFRQWESPVYNDNRIVIRFNALVCLFSFGHLQVHTVFANFVSFTGLVALYKFFLNYLPKNKTIWLKWGIFLFPSLLFWGSGILKETILIGCLGMAVYSTDTLFQNKKILWLKILIILACTGVMIFLKTYILLLLLPCFAGFYISRNMNFLKTHLVYFFMFAGLIMAAAILHIFLPELSPVKLIAGKQNDLIRLSLHVNAGSLLHDNFLKPQFWDIIRNIPAGFLTTLLRPHIFEADTILKFFSGFENLLIMVLILTAVIIPSSIKKQSAASYMSFWFFLAGFSFVGLATPVAGAIVRYKIIMLPFLWFLLINIADTKKINNKFNNFKTGIY